MGAYIMSTPQRVLDSIRRLVRLLRAGSRASEAAVGLSTAQLFVLQKLDGERPLSLNELAARTLTHQSSVSVVVSRLAERGLVRRRPAPGDARRLELALTPRGREVLARSPGSTQDRIIAAVAALPPAEQEALADALEAIVGAAGADGRAAPMLFTDEAAESTAARRRRTPRPKRANKRV